MKKYLFPFLIFLSAAVITSCEEDFNINATFTKDYILTCIIRSDTSFQSAVLTSSYEALNNDPYSNTEDPFIQNADIRIRQRDDIVFLRDTCIAKVNASKYSDSLRYYYTDNFIPSGTDSVDIIATLSDGRQLIGSTILATEVSFDSSSDHILPDTSDEFFTFSWTPTIANQWYAPRILMYYKISDDFFTKEIPLDIISGQYQYSSISISNHLAVKNLVLDSTFQNIYNSVEDKSSVTILGGVMEVLILDNVLSNYYSSTNGFLDDFTVIVDEKDYTNIRGGYGVFGSYLKQKFGFSFSAQFVHSFGFSTIN